jgi:hypothetical protein
MLEQEVKYAREGDSRRFRTSKHHTDAGREDAGIVHEFGVVVRCLCEFRQQIYALGVYGVGGKSKLLDLLDGREAFCRARLCEEGYREDRFRETNSLGEEAERVLLKEEVEDGHLSDLYQSVMIPSFREKQGSRGNTYGSSI